jgi:hypothetical protein
MPKKENPIDKFNRNYIVDSISGCWIYQKIGKDNYGRIFLNNKYIKAHRFSYETFVGPLNTELEICHNCNCKACVNPNHLRQDTRSSNAIDRVYDANNSNQKLTPEQVIEIKIALQNPYYGIQRYLAKKYKVHYATINDIKTKKRWSHLTIE